MTRTVFFYKYTPVLAEKLYSLCSCNKVEKILIVNSATDDVFLTPDAVYAAVEYLNYEIDPFFVEAADVVDACCVKTAYYPLRDYFDVALGTIYVEVLLPLMPKTRLLKKIGALAISTELAAGGLYKLTFVRKCRGEQLKKALRALQNNVDAFIPNMPILVIGVYSAYWYRRCRN